MNSLKQDRAGKLRHIFSGPNVLGRENKYATNNMLIINDFFIVITHGNFNTIKM